MGLIQKSITSLFPFALASVALSAQGQVIPDRSLSTTVEQQGNTAEIRGGREVGNNLFHSFQDFSLPRDNTAFFDNSLQIENILSRVTGGRISNIDGLIRVNGSANLFLLNPAGIVFGENARLDVGGSFLASTANGLLFDDGTEFQANGSVAVLTINAPVGLNLREVTGDLNSRGNLSSQGDLTLSGNNLDLQGELTAVDNLSLTAINTVTVRDDSTRPFVANAGKDLTIAGGNVDLFILNNPASGLLSGRDLSLQSDRPINGDAHYYSGGDFSIEKLDRSLGSWVSLQDPVVRSQGDVSFAGYTGASLHILAAGNVTVTGDINIIGVDTTNNSLQETIALSNGDKIEIDGNAQPTLDIRAGIANVELPGITGDGINLDVNNNPIGSNILIDGAVNNPGGIVFLSNQYRANNQLAAGNITVRAINTSHSLEDGGDVVIDSRGDINLPDGINTSSIVNSELVTVAVTESPDDHTLRNALSRNITAGKGGAVALFATKDILAGDVRTTSQINLDLITEVDTIDEANLDFAFPQADLQVNGGGNINLAGNNLTVENINSTSLVAIDSNATALDNFSIVSAVLGVDIAEGGDINLQANNITTGDVNSNVALTTNLNANSQTTPNINLGVAEIFLTISPVNIASGGDIFLEAANQINTQSLNSSISVTNQSNNTAIINANNQAIADSENPAEAFSLIDLLIDNIEIDRGGAITIKSARANLGNINSSLNITSENTVFAEANADNDAVGNASANSIIVLQGAGDRPGTITLDVDRGINFNAIDNNVNLNAINNLDSLANSNGENSIANADNTSSNTINFDAAIDLSQIIFNLDLPDLDLVISDLPEINNLQPAPNNNLLKANSNSPLRCQQPQSSAIETAKGKIYPARNVIVKNGQILLTSQSDRDFRNCL